MRFVCVFNQVHSGQRFEVCDGFQSFFLLIFTGIFSCLFNTAQGFILCFILVFMPRWPTYCPCWIHAVFHIAPGYAGQQILAGHQIFSGTIDFQSSR